MGQAKLRAARGEGNVGRQEVVEVIIEESVQAAQIGVKERFAEIARERGFDKDYDVEGNCNGIPPNFVHSLGRRVPHFHFKCPMCLALNLNKL